MDQADRLMRDLFPLCRSVAGSETVETLRRLQREIPIELRSVPSGSQVLDWTVPRSWQITAAHITERGTGRRVVDFADSNLHVVSHSHAVNATLTLDELQPHLHSLPDRPNSIPYRTAYYQPNWGFCLSQQQRDQLRPGDYDVVIDTSFDDSGLSWGELVVPGEDVREILLTTHICHPSLANDNLTGIAALVEIGRRLLAGPARRFTYRLLFIPGTIGAISWLASADTAKVHQGLVLTGLGDGAPLTYKQSRRGDHEIDRVAGVMLRDREHRILPFSPYGYDERQFCSPGFDMPVGRLTRGVHGTYAEYHTSADDLSFVSLDQLDIAIDFVCELLDALEANTRPVNLKPRAEPQLGRYGLYSTVGGGVDQKSVEMAYLWTLNMADGTADLASIAANSGLPMGAVILAAQLLERAGLLQPDISTSSNTSHLLRR